VSAAFLNISIGLATSVLSGGAVWLWQRARNARILRRKAAFFGVERGGTCLIIMNNTWDTPGRSSHHDVHAMIEAATLASEVGCAISVHRQRTERRTGHAPRPVRSPSKDLTSYLVLTSLRQVLADRARRDRQAAGEREGQGHGAADEVLIPVLEEFFA
jgi:hypothetical protein